MSPTRSETAAELTTLSTGLYRPHKTDKENEPGNTFNTRQPPGTVKKQLFRTPLPAKQTPLRPAPPRSPSRRIPPPPTPSTRIPPSRTPPTRTPSSRSSSASHSDPVARRFPRSKASSIAKTPRSPRTRHADITRLASLCVTPASKLHRPNVASLATTPGMRHKYATRAPDMWRARQVQDLTAWLNAELVDSTLDRGSLSLDGMGKSVVFFRQVSDMSALYKSPEVQAVLKKVDKEILQGRFFVSRKIELLTHLKSRKDLASLFLHNYHPMWLLLGLCVLLGRNLGVSLDRELQNYKRREAEIDAEEAFREVLNEAISSGLLAANRPDHRRDTPSSARKLRGVQSQQRDMPNGLILSRILHLIFLLDQAKQSREPIISTDPPLFRCGSHIASSLEVIEHLQKHYLPEQGDVVRFLYHREYVVKYETPVFERMHSLRVEDLSKDLCDGTRLCKLASVMTKDRCMLSRIRRDKAEMSQKALLSCHLVNVRLALSQMQEYACSHMDGPFEWNGTHQDVVKGDMDKTISLLWQIVSLWLEIVVLDRKLLECELKYVQQQFRDSQNVPRLGVLSPGGAILGTEIRPRKISPSRLTVYENCTSVSSQLLLQWCTTVTGIYGVAVRDFTESFRDGAALCLILHHYCPDLVKIHEVTLVQLAELRPVIDSRAEADLAQKNFDLFTERVRTLGTIPDISISAEVALAPSFFSYEKEISFGGVMEVLSSYLFRRVVLEKEARKDKTYIETFAAEELKPGAPRDKSVTTTSTAMQQEGIPSHSSRTERNYSAKGTKSSASNDKGVSAASDVANTLLHGAGKSANDSVSDINSTSSASKPRQGQNNEYVTGQRRSAVVVEGQSDIADYRSDDSGNVPKENDTNRKMPRQYRAAKDRNLHQRKTDSAVSVQAAVRGSFARIRAQVDLITSADADRAASAAFANAVCPGQQKKDAEVLNVEDTEGTTDSQQPCSPAKARPEAFSEVLKQVSSVLPVLRSHSDSTAAFVNRLVRLERTDAAGVIQNSYRSYSASNSLGRAQFELAERQRTKSKFSSILSKIPEAARQVAQRVAAEAEQHRKDQISNLTSALKVAEHSYDNEMSLARDRRKELEAQLRLRRELSAKIQATRAEDERRYALEFRNEIHSLNEKVAELDARADEKDSYLQQMNESTRTNLNKSPSPIRQASLSPGRIDASLVHQESPSRRDSYDERFRLLQELRERENSIGKELDQLHSEWAADLAAREEKLSNWKTAVLESTVNHAEHKYELHMRCLRNARADALERKQRFDLEGEKLHVEETEASAEISAAEAEQAEALRALDLVLVQKETEIALQTAAINENYADKDAGLRELIVAEQKSQQSELAWRSCLQGFSEEAAQSTNELHWYEEWKVESDRADRALDERIEESERSQAEAVRLRSLLEEAERNFSETMLQCKENALKDAILRAEGKAKLSSLAAEEQAQKLETENMNSSLNTAISHVEAAREEYQSFLQSFETPEKAHGSPSLLFSPYRNRSSPSPATKQFQNLREDINKTLEFIEAERTTQDLQDNYSPYMTNPDEEVRSSTVSDAPRVFNESTFKSVPIKALPSSDAFHAEILGSLSKGPYMDMQSLDAPLPLAPKGLEHVAAGPSLALSGSITSPASSAFKPTVFSSLGKGRVTATSVRNLSPTPVLQEGTSSEESPLPRSGGDASPSRQSQSGMPPAVESQMLHVSSPTQASSSNLVVRKGEGGQSPVLSTWDGSRAPNTLSSTIFSAPETHPPVDSRTKDVSLGPARKEPSHGHVIRSAVMSRRHGSPDPITLQPDVLDITEKRPLAFESNATETSEILGAQEMSQIEANPDVVPIGNGSPSCLGVHSEVARSPEKQLDWVSFETDNVLVAALDDIAVEESNPTLAKLQHYSSPGAPLPALSEELKALNIGTSSLDKAQEVMNSPSSFDRLDSIMRRLSAASASLAAEGVISSSAEESGMTSATSESDGGSEAKWSLNLIKTIFIVIRQCTRTKKHIALVELGISIIRNLCKDETHLHDVYVAEDCVEVVVTCVQFYRDNETILSSAVEVLLLISSCGVGYQLILAEEGIMRQIHAVHNILKLQGERERRHADRYMRTEIVLNALKRRSERAGAMIPLAQEIDIASENTPQRRYRPPLSRELLGQLVHRFPIKSEKSVSA